VNACVNACVTDDRYARVMRERMRVMRERMRVMRERMRLSGGHFYERLLV
jgi:hypothetical protein